MAWVEQHAVAIAPVAAALLFIILAVPYSIYFGRLGTSASDAGLSYPRILADSVLGVVALTAVAVIVVVPVAALIAYVTFVYAFHGYSQQRDPFAPVGGWSFDEAERRLAVHYPVVARSFRSSGLQPLHDTRRQLGALGVRDEEQQQRFDEVNGQLNKLLRKATLRGMATDMKERSFRLAPRTFTAVLIFAAAVIMPLLAWMSADQVRNCETPRLASFGFALGGSPVELRGTGVSELRVPRGTLMLLGSDERRYVAFHCRQRTTVYWPRRDDVTLLLR